MLNAGDQPEYLAYQYSEIEHEKDTKLRIRDYAVVQDKNRFLFAADTPNELQLGLKFALKDTVLVKIKPLYPDWICGAAGTGNAYIKLNGHAIDKTLPLRPGEVNEFSLEVANGERVQISLYNPEQKNCGRAEITLLEKNTTQFYPAIFTAIWLLVFIGLHYLNLSITHGLIGVGVNLGIVYANSTISILNFTNLINASLLALSLLGALLLIQILPIARVLRIVLSTIVILCFCSVIFIYAGHYLLFGVPVSADTIHAILQTDMAETVE
ncbi:MAG: hypothetical protein HKN85_07660, partial [Gammaproteobacteria bacterium]|nr:hypothetical protein [Gammaproteobacteria bacterium]